MNEYDEHQLTIMLNKISEFKSNRLSFSSLIYDLEALLNVLEENDQNWKISFIEYWWELEEIYAVALDQDKSLIALENTSIMDAISHITKLIKMKLASDRGLACDL